MTQYVDAIDYVTFATTGNASNFGNTTVARMVSAGVGNETRGVFVGGEYPDNQMNTTVDYVTIATTGNATSFQTITARGYSGGFASTTRGVYGGGIRSGAYTSNIEYLTIATTGSVATFGSLTIARSLNHAGASSSTRGIFFLGYASTTATNRMDYVTIASTGNATTFGNLTGGVNNGSQTYNTALTDATTAITAGGGGDGGANVRMDYVTIATTGNGTFWGNMQGRSGNQNYYFAGTSNCHGGL